MLAKFKKKKKKDGISLKKKKKGSKESNLGTWAYFMWALGDTNHMGMGRSTTESKVNKDTARSPLKIKNILGEVMAKSLHSSEPNIIWSLDRQLLEVSFRWKGRW